MADRATTSSPVWSARTGRRAGRVHGARYYRPNGEAFIPVEFADAAYRYGHSQIRQLYRLQPDGPLYPVFPDLIGFGPIEERRVDWSLLFDVPGRPAAQRSKPIDGQLPRSLIELPQAITGEIDDEAYRSLASRDLERGQGTGLPSGEAVARLLGVDVLTERELDLRRHGWEGETPLWLYILREASARHAGNRLGDVGARIVAEVLHGVIAADPESYLALEPDWTPTLPAHAEGFRLADLLVPDHIDAPKRTFRHLAQLRWAANGLAESWHVPRVTRVVPRAATGETKRPVTSTVVPGKAPAGCPEYANVPLAELRSAAASPNRSTSVRSVKLRILRPVPEIRKFTSEKM